MSAEQKQDVDLPKWIGLGFLVGLVVAALTLEYYGYIKHPTELDQATIAEFRLLVLKPDVDIKISEKPSGKEAFCVNGFLLLRPTNGAQAAGVLVDDKQRAIACDLIPNPHLDTKEPRP